MDSSILAHRKGSGTVIHLTIGIEIRRPSAWPPGWFPYSPTWGVPPVSDPGVQVLIDVLADLVADVLRRKASAHLAREGDGDAAELTTGLQQDY
jgi:hypothetical protein